MLWGEKGCVCGWRYFRKKRVIELIQEKLPVSLSLGIWVTVISYLVSIPRAIRKAVQDVLKQKTAYEMPWCLEFRRVLFRSDRKSTRLNSKQKHTRCHGDWSSDVCSSD